jgi:predicted acetyltransferase
VFELDRATAALDRDRIVGTANSYSFDMTVPGGATVPVGGLSGVVVLPTHRRRGVLTAMLREQLDDTARRGDVANILNASEGGIYGRFGYGLAQLYTVVEIWRDRAAFTVAPPQIPLRLVPQADAEPVLAPLWDAARLARPGSLSRSSAWWACVLSEKKAWKGGGNLHIVATDGVPPEAGGFAIYTITSHDHPRGWTVHVKEMVAADPAVEARLWEHLLAVDLSNKVVVDGRPVDDPLRWRMADPRAYRTRELRDYLFVRLLDVPAALSARSYAAGGSLVVEVIDTFRPDAGGVFALEVDEAGTGVCLRSDAPADLVLSQEALGSLYLGGVRARDLALAGRIDERTDGAVVAADLMFSWPVAPFCQTRF